MNLVILQGRLGADPELKTSAAGKPFANLRIATDDGWGENEKTNWHSVTLFGARAEAAHRYLKKGDGVIVRGRVDYSSSEKDGVTRWYTNILGDNWEFPLSSAERRGSTAAAETEPSSEDTEDEDSIPF